MKSYFFNLDKHFVDSVFSPLRTKSEALVVLMKCVKLMLVGNIVPRERAVGKLLLTVDKQSRLYLFSDSKYFSLGFPFFVNNQEDLLRFSTRDIENIDNKITSDVIGVLSSTDQYDNNSVFDFIEPVLEIEEKEPRFWAFLLGLLMYEDGYVRYDHDPKHENGDLHPINHYDFFYSSSASCKVGLRKKLEHTDMIDFLSTNTSCHYIEELP